MAQTFVFIDEDQQKKYSKSTLSAINAQVAKYAHQQRKSAKPHSAPSSPPSLGEDTQTTEKPAKTQHGNNNRRRSSQPQPTRRISPTTAKTLKHFENVSENHRRRKSASPPTVCGPAEKPKDTTHEKGQNGDAAPGDLADLFQDLCRITKHPPYQAFPFFLDLEERRLAHYWFTEVLKDDFGMRLQLEDTFQGQLTRYPLAFPVSLMWIIAKAADKLNEKTGSQSLTVVYRSREKALNRLQDILNDSATPTDEAIGSILQSIVHNPEHRKVHLRGMDTMIAARGGLEEVIKESRVTCSEHMFLQYTFAPFDIYKLEELETLKTEFFDALLAMQAHADEFQQMNAFADIWASSVDLADTSGNCDNLKNWSYTEQRKRIFSECTAFGQLLRAKYDISAEDMRKSRLFAALFQLNAMLIEYHTTDEKSLFLRRLEEAAEKASSRDPATGAQTMMAGAHIYLTGYVSRLTQEELGQTTYDAKGVPVAERGIAAIKIFWLLPESIRSTLVHCLQGWLLGDVASHLSPEAVSAMSTVVTQLWMQKMQDELDPPQATDYFAEAA